MISHTEPRQKKSRLCQVCEKRPPVVRINPRRNPFSRKAKKGKAVILKAHDVCRQCWKVLAKRSFFLPN